MNAVAPFFGGFSEVIGLKLPVAAFGRCHQMLRPKRAFQIFVLRPNSRIKSGLPLGYAVSCFAPRVRNVGRRRGKVLQARFNTQTSSLGRSGEGASVIGGQGFGYKLQEVARPFLENYQDE